MLQVKVEGLPAGEIQSPVPTLIDVASLSAGARNKSSQTIRIGVRNTDRAFVIATQFNDTKNNKGKLYLAPALQARLSHRPNSNRLASTPTRCKRSRFNRADLTRVFPPRQTCGTSCLGTHAFLIPSAYEKFNCPTAKRCFNPRQSVPRGILHVEVN